jgi:S1-C subfamily serine protease
VFLKKFICLLLVPMLMSCGIMTQFLKEQLPRHSYLFVKKILNLKKCTKDKCSNDTYVSVGSGFIIKTTSLGSFALTAAHVCANDFKETKEIKVSNQMKVQTLDGRYYIAEILSQDRNLDVCLLFVEDLVDDIEQVKIADKAPREGDKVINIASPFGIHYNNVVPIFEGRYIGKVKFRDFYTIPAAPGSSGSMILNEDGELIGLLHSVFIGMNEIVVSVSYSSLKQFIKRNMLRYSPRETRSLEEETFLRYQKISGVPK